MLLYLIFLSLIVLIDSQRRFQSADYEIPPELSYQPSFFHTIRPEESPYVPIGYFSHSPVVIPQEELLPYGGLFTSSPTLNSFLRTPSPTSMHIPNLEPFLRFTQTGTVATPITTIMGHSSPSYQLKSAEYSRRIDPTRISLYSSTPRPTRFSNGRLEERVVEKILDNLPALAASFMNSAGPHITGSRLESSTLPSLLNTRHPDSSIENNGQSYRSIKAPNVVDVVSAPSSLFSFGNLMSSLNQQPVGREIRPSFIKGTSILKSEDKTPNHRNSAEAFVGVDSEPVMETTTVKGSLLTRLLQPLLRSTPTNITADKTAETTHGSRRDVSSVWTHFTDNSDGKRDTDETVEEPKQDLMSRLMSGNFGDILNIARNATSESAGAKKPKSADGDDTSLLKTLLNGQLSEVNWLDMILGPSSSTSGASHAEEGNALAQLFGSGGKSGDANSGNPFGRLSAFFGSGLDDDPSIPNKSVKRNF